MNLLTIILMASAALLALALAALFGLVRARREVGRLRAESEAARRALDRATAEGQGHLARVGDRDARLQEVLAEVARMRADHRDAESRCAEAETRCAKATEGGERLEATLRQHREDARAIVERLQAVEADHSRLRADHAALRTDRDGRLESAAREVEALKSVREEMTREFRDLATRTLQETGPRLSEAHQQKLSELLTPFKEQVGRFEVELREVHKHAGLDRAVLTEQIKALTSQTQAVSQDAANLARALKGDKQRQGAWGESQLERYLELMGYKKGIDYVTQSSRTGDEGDRLRPDVVLRMPGGKALVIDSKVSLSAYADAIAAETEEEREAHLRLHARNVRNRVDELASKDYHHLIDGSVDWVLLFMPVEGAVSAAWAVEADIGAYAMEKGIGIAYPTTLLMALRTVKHLWDVENRNRHAERIAERAGLLYDKLAGFIDSFTSVGRAIGQAQTAHDRALGQLTKGAGNLVGQVEKLKTLGARTGKRLGLDHDAEPEEEGDALSDPREADPATILPAAE